MSSPAAAATAISGREVELKLLVAPDDLARIADLALVRTLIKGDIQRSRDTTTYFDTPDLALARRGVALRVRRRGHRRIQTVKMIGEAEPHDGAGVSVRREWQWTIDSDQPRLDLIDGDGLQELVPATVAARVTGLFVTDIQRTLLPLATGDGSLIELALDIGQASVTLHDKAPGGDVRQRTICELEIELRQGEVAALFELAAAIHDRIHLRLSTRSKADIGLSLITGAQPKAVLARPLALTPVTTVTEGFRHIMRNGLAHLLDNQDAVAATGNAAPDILRELAAATRRLETGYGLFRPYIYDEKGDRLRQSLRDLARPLERARRWQRLAAGLAVLEAPLRRQVVGAVSQARERALSKARTTLLSPDWTAWQLSFAAWLERGHWVRDGASPFGPTMEESSADMLSRRLGKVLKAGRALSRARVPSPEELVRLHKQMRKLRYTLDFCRAVWPPERVEALLAAVDTLRPLIKRAADAERGARLLAAIDQPQAAAALRSSLGDAQGDWGQAWAAFLESVAAAP